MIRYRGVAYYPEFWPKERWDEDIRLMREARINLVRIGEFAWAAMEPADGRFTLDWLHEVTSRFEAAGIDVMLCTPTAAPPAWLTSRHPDALLVRRDGRHAAHGARRQYCPTSPIYRRYARRIADRLSREFARHRNVIAWQIDNEIGPEMSFCHCTGCSDRFRIWLRSRYGTLEALNAAWQTRFWSVSFSKWRQIHLRLEAGYPSIELDIKRFHSDSFIDFVRCQAEVIRANHPAALVTTNMVGPPLLPYTDYYRLADILDVVADDLYFDVGTMDADSLACDMFRCAASPKPVWLTETGIAALGLAKDPDSRRVRSWAYSALARGTETHLFFRWRTCPAGQEQDLQGVLETSGRPHRRYEAVRALFRELESLASAFADLPPLRASVALVLSYDVLWAYESTRVGRLVRYPSHVQSLYRCLWDMNVLVDVIPPNRDLSPYRLVVLPSLCIVDRDFCTRLRAFVQAGGTVVATPQLANRDSNNNYVTSTPPGDLSPVFGLEVASHTYLQSTAGPDEALWFPQPFITEEHAAVRLENGIEGKAACYLEEVVPSGCRPIATYQDNRFAGCPAATRNDHGNGTAWYLASYLDPALLAEILGQAMTATGILMTSAPPWVEIVRRGDVTFIINHGDVPARIEMRAGIALIGALTDGVVRLEPFDVVAIRSDASSR